MAKDERTGMDELELIGYMLDFFISEGYHLRMGAGKDMTRVFNGGIA